MANSMPFNSINADRPYKAEDWAWYFGTFIGNGVFPKPETGLQVVANEGMKITVNEGKAFINGYAFKNPSNYEITLDTADGALARIDRVVVRWDLVNRDMYIEVLKGTVSASPVAQAITRDTETYDLVLADIYVGKGVTSIAQANITDQRFNTSVCGIVKGTVEEIDTSVIIAQFEDFVKTYQDEQLAEFEEWVESIKDVLNESAAGNLQLQIDDHTEKSVSSENGVHGFRYFEGKLQAHVYDEESMTLKWVTVPGSGIDYDGEKSVKGAIDDVRRTLGYTKSYNSLDNTASTITKNGLTFTVNSDKSVTVVGTPTADTFIIINTYTEKQGQHILSGCPSGGSASGYRLYCYNVSTNITINTDLGEGVEFTLDENLEIGVSILVKSGTVMNHTFYPMIRPADIEDDTYMPYEEDVHTRIKDLDGRILSIKQKTVTVTTDAHGNALLGLNSAVHLLNVKSETYMLNNMLGFIPCVSNYNWYVRVTQNSNTYNPLASKQITLIVTYLE